MAEDFAGKIAVITGGCQGMGQEALEQFVAQGAKVVVADIQDEKGRQLESRYPHSVKYVHCDVTRDVDIVAALAAAESAFGGLDMLFNNAGSGLGWARLDQITVDQWDAVQNLNLRSCMLGMKYAIPMMKRRGGGSIVSTVSIAAQTTGWGPFAYAVAKAGLEHLTRLVAVEAAAANVRVNAVSPGVIVTPPTARACGYPVGEDGAIDSRVFDIAKQMQPLPRCGTAADIVKAALFLFSDSAAFITGQVLVVDGGLTLGSRHAWDPRAISPFDEGAKFASENWFPVEGDSVKN